MAGDRQHKMLSSQNFWSLQFFRKPKFVLMAGDRQHKINCRHKIFGAFIFSEKTNFVLMAGDRQHKMLSSQKFWSLQFF